MILSVDIGRTFTDFVLFNNQGWRTYKIFSRTHPLEDIILKGVHDLELNDAVASGELLIVHNNEAANFGIEKTDARTIFIKHHALLIAPFFSELTKNKSILAFNMGGSSTHISLIENTVLLSENSINLGGESIAYLDDRQLLQISTRPTEVHLGSVCYGLGSDQPTITDANLIVGRLRPDIILGNTLRPDVNSARMALAKLAGALNKRVEDVALSIINITNQKIIASLQLILSQSNLRTPSALWATGGCGGLHVCAVADALNIKNVVVPLFGGVFSAINMLMTNEPNVLLPILDYKQTRAAHYRIQLYGITLPVSVWQRHELSPEEMIMGPALIMEDTTTIFLQNGWLAYVDPAGHLLLRRMAIDVY